MTPLNPMKTKLLLFVAWLSAAAGLHAAALTATTAVHTKPDEASPVISYLKAGSTPVVATKVAQAPAGWTAVDITGPFEAYVQNKDLNKSLDVRPGTAFRLQPKVEAVAVATMEPGDKIEITGLRGKWTQLKVSKAVTGYIRVSMTSAAAAAPKPAATTPVATAPAPRPAAAQPQPQPEQAPAPAPMLTPASGGGAAPMISDAGSILPRSYQGKFVSSRRPFAPRRPYDYQINDDAGIRFAYLDLSKLMLTDSLEKYIDRDVVVYGVARNVNDTKEIVVEVDTLQLK